MEFFVSKGTYIRSLARDLGESLGYGATLYSLRRTKTSEFEIEDCVPLENLTEENIGNHILSEETVVSHLREIFVTEKQAVRFCNGGQLSFDRLHTPTDDFGENELFRIKHNNIFLGVGVADLENRQIAIKCVMRNLTPPTSLRSATVSAPASVGASKHSLRGVHRTPAPL